MTNVLMPNIFLLQFTVHCIIWKLLSLTFFLYLVLRRVLCWVLHRIIIHLQYYFTNMLTVAVKFCFSAIVLKYTVS